MSNSPETSGFFAHYEELRNRLIKSISSIFAAACFFYIFVDDVLTTKTDGDRHRAAEVREDGQRHVGKLERDVAEHRHHGVERYRLHRLGDALVRTEPRQDASAQ